ncbi:MAG: hypothetical protein ABI629_02965 [bacterium]
MVAFSTCFAAADASATSISLPTNAVINVAGQTTVVPVSIGSTDGVSGFAINFTYSSALATATLVQGTTLTANCLIEPNLGTAGVVRITAACSSVPQGMSGAVFNVTFQGVANGVSPLTFLAAPSIPNGCLLNEGSPTCEPSNGQLTVGPMQPTSTVTASGTATATRTATAVATASATATVTHTAVATSTATFTATNTAPPSATATRTPTATVTDTATSGPSPTVTQTRTVTNTGTPTLTATPTLTTTPTSTPQSSNTVTATVTASLTPSVTATPTASNTATATPIATPRITSGAAGGSTRVFGVGAPNVSAPGIEIVAENGNQVIGTGGTNGAGAFTDGQAGIGLTRPLVAGERIFPRDVTNGVTGPFVIVAPQPPTQIPTVDHYGSAALALLIGAALLWQLAALARRSS